MLCAYLFSISPAEARNTQELRVIGDGARVFLEQSLNQRGNNDEIEFKIQRLDPRLKLPQCANPLTYQFHGQHPNDGNVTGLRQVTLKATCPDEAGWSIYVRARLEHFRHVAVSNRDIARGERLAIGDIRLERRSTTGLGATVISELEPIVGMLAKRSLRANSIIRRSGLIQPRAVHKGDQVAIRAIDGAIAVVSSGVALGSGRIGEQIRIQNSRSDRIIKARVTGPGEVQVNL
jgi:flagella basal body P-ring formation protein FlgA